MKNGRKREPRCSWLILGSLLVVTLLTCGKDLDSPTDVPIEEILRILLGDDASLLADGVSQLAIAAQIPANSNTRDVTFRTTMGTLLGGTKPQELVVRADRQGVATATLVAGSTVGAGLVSATISGHVSTSEVQFQRAHAEQIELETSTRRVTTNGSTSAVLTAKLRRTGTVSLETPVRFEATQRSPSGRIEVGRFTGLFQGEGLSAADQTVKATFFADTGDIDPKRRVQIRVATDTGDGGEEDDSLTLIVIEAGG